MLPSVASVGVPFVLSVFMLVTAHIGGVIFKAAEGDRARMWKLVKELVGAIWFNLAVAPLGVRIASYYYLRSRAILKDIPFGSPRNCTLDVHLCPKSASPGHKCRAHKYPVVVFVYGGAWSSGDKAIYALVGDTLRDEGVITVIPNYTLYPKGTMVDMVADLSCTLDWVVQHIHTVGGDAQRIYLVGHSAGGHLATTLVLRRLYQDHHLPLTAAVGPPLSTTPLPLPLSLAPKWLSSAGPPVFQDQCAALPGAKRWSLSHIRAVIALSAPFDIAEHYEFEQRRAVHLLSGMWGAAGGHPDAHSAVTLVRSLRRFSTNPQNNLPRIHVLHATSDTTVPEYESQHFVESAVDAGIHINSSVFSIKGTHFSIVENLMWGPPGAPRPTLDFLRHVIEDDICAQRG